MVFDYNGNGDATAACIFNRSQTYVTASSTCSGAALKTGYGYTTISSKVYLTSATDVLGNTTTYTQSVYGGVTCIKPPAYARCKASMSPTAGPVFSAPHWHGGARTIWRVET